LKQLKRKRRLRLLLLVQARVVPQLRVRHRLQRPRNSHAMQETSYLLR
jgi:hypothetical protein